MTAIPSLFVSHGAPELILGRSPARDFLEDLGRGLARPRAVVVASAHWASGRPLVGGADRPRTLHDLCAGAQGTCRIRYPAPGDRALAARVAGLLQAAGIPASIDPERGLDHGAWVPLRLMFPDADIPVVPLSIQPGQGPLHHLAMGRALAPLAADGVLVLGSGGVTSNIHASHGRAEDAPVPAWVTQFQDWLADRLLDIRLLDGDLSGLTAGLERAPARRENHPTPEHLLPLFVALGAAGDGVAVERLHASVTHGALAMDAYAFAPAARPRPLRTASLEAVS